MITAAFGKSVFLFMVFAAITTVIAVIENIVTYGMDLTGWQKNHSVNLVLLLLSLPCVWIQYLESFESAGKGKAFLIWKIHFKQ